MCSRVACAGGSVADPVSAGPQSSRTLVANRFKAWQQQRAPQRTTGASENNRRLREQPATVSPIAALNPRAFRSPAGYEPGRHVTSPAGVALACSANVRGRTRTCGLGFRKASLYPPELRGPNSAANSPVHVATARPEQQRIVSEPRAVQPRLIVRLPNCCEFRTPTTAMGRRPSPLWPLLPAISLPARHPTVGKRGLSRGKYPPGVQQMQADGIGSDPVRLHNVRSIAARDKVEPRTLTERRRAAVLSVLR